MYVGEVNMVDYCPKCRSRLYMADYEDVKKYGCCHYCIPNVEERKNYLKKIAGCFKNE